jgi:hypothetical protein
VANRGKLLVFKQKTSRASYLNDAPLEEREIKVRPPLSYYTSGFLILQENPKKLW